MRPCKSASTTVTIRTLSVGGTFGRSSTSFLDYLTRIHTVLSQTPSSGDFGHSIWGFGDAVPSLRHERSQYLYLVVNIPIPVLQRKIYAHHSFPYSTIESFRLSNITTDICIMTFHLLFYVGNYIIPTFISYDSTQIQRDGILRCQENTPHDKIRTKYDIVVKVSQPDEITKKIKNLW